MSSTPNGLPPLECARSSGDGDDGSGPPDIALARNSPRKDAAVGSARPHLPREHISQKQCCELSRGPMSREQALGLEDIEVTVRCQDTVACTRLPRSWRATDNCAKRSGGWKRSSRLTAPPTRTAQTLGGDHGRAAEALAAALGVDPGRAAKAAVGLACVRGRSTPALRLCCAAGGSSRVQARRWRLSAAFSSSLDRSEG